MFDIGFFELLLIGVVGLIVIGPEKLPSTIRTVALWFGRLKRSISETRAEVEKQLGADDIRRELHNEQVMRNLENMRNAHSDLEAKIQRLGSETLNPPIEHDAPPEQEHDQTVDNTEDHLTTTHTQATDQDGDNISDHEKENTIHKPGGDT